MKTNKILPLKARRGSGMTPVRRYDQVTDKIYRGLDILIGWLLVVLVINVLLIILSRQIGVSVAWAYDLARWLVIWMAFIGSVSLSGQGSHLAIDFIFTNLPRRLQLVGATLTAAGAVAFAGIVVYYGATEVYRMNAFNERSSSGAFPAAVGYSVLPIAFALILAASIDNFVRTIRSHGGNGKKPGGSP